MQNIISFIVNLLAITLFVAILLPADALSKEPKSFKDLWDNWSVYSRCDEPFVYRIQNTSDTICGAKWLSDLGTIKGISMRPEYSSPNAQGFLLDCGKTSFYINIIIFSSSSNIKGTFIGSMASYSGNQEYLMPATASAFTGYQPPPNVPRSFFNTQFEQNLIGDISFDRRFGNFEEHSVYQVVFTRGNTFVCIHFPYPRGGAFRKEPYPDKQVPEDYQPDKNGLDKLELDMVPILFDVKQPFDIDPRKIAYQYDRYLTDCPLKKLQDNEKRKLKTLDIHLPKDTEFEQGKEYPLDFPRKSPDGTVPAEIRLVVSRGEIQQIIETNVTEGTTIFPNPALLAPDIDGKYTVLFGQPEKQTVHCYHINEEGKCLAWGEIEVSVKKTEEQQKQEE